MPTMASSPRLVVHGHHQPAKPIVVHHPNPKDLNDKVAAVASCEFCALDPGMFGLPMDSMPVSGSCNLRCSEDRGNLVITYGLAEVRCGHRWSPQEWGALEYKVPRPLRGLVTKGINKRSTATSSNDDGRIQSRRVRTPPPTPKPQRLPTPDISDSECDNFCNCCNSTNENAQLVKAKTKRRIVVEPRKGMMWKHDTFRNTP